MGLDAIFCRAGWGGVNQYVTLRTSDGGMLNGQWRHLAYRREGQTLSLWVDGVVRETRSDPNYASSFYSETLLPSAVGQVYQDTDSDWPFEMADLRIYDRALSDEEIGTLSQH